MQSRLADMDLTKITITPGYSRAQSHMPGSGHNDRGGGSTTDAQLTDDDVSALRGIEGIMYIAGEISGREEVGYTGETSTLSIKGVDPQVWQYMTTLETESGRMLKPADKYVAVVGSGVASGIFDQDVGINQVITINGKSVRIVGILAEEGGSEDRQIYIPIDSALVGAVGIANTMFTAVLEKTKEIGTMKAIGAKNRDILMIFVYNSAMVGFVGGIFGVMLGGLVSALFPFLGVTIMRGGRGMSLSLSPGRMIFGLTLAVLIGIISGAIPAYRASKLKPVEALRYE